LGVKKFNKKRKNAPNSIYNGVFLLFLHPYETNHLLHFADASAADRLRRQQEGWAQG
jgi:hypothetical protein